jgi:hypothetical protein
MPTTLVLQFSEALDPTRAADPSNYAIVRADGARVTFVSAAYDPDAWTVTLHPKQRIDLHLRYVLTVNGVAPSGLISASGVYLDGNGQGVAGTSASRNVNSANLVLPKDSHNIKPRVGIHHGPLASKSRPILPKPHSAV